MEENEAVFRNYNEQVQDSLVIINAVALAEQEPALRQGDTPLQYYCECSDETCQKRISLKPSQYEDTHKKRDHFVLLPGHHVDKIEKVISKNSRYWVVKKYNTPRESADQLNTTNVDNN